MLGTCHWAWSYEFLSLLNNDIMDSNDIILLFLDHGVKLYYNKNSVIRRLSRLFQDKISLNGV
jgi:hypothetical protein